MNRLPVFVQDGVAGVAVKITSIHLEDSAKTGMVVSNRNMCLFFMLKVEI